MKLQEMQILYPQFAVVDRQDPQYVNKLGWAFFFSCRSSTGQPINSNNAAWVMAQTINSYNQGSS